MDLSDQIGSVWLKKIIVGTKVFFSYIPLNLPEWPAFHSSTDSYFFSAKAYIHVVFEDTNWSVILTW